jgi:DNA-binding transcriptional regulator/RsmH inhibitor MraZ
MSQIEFETMIDKGAITVPSEYRGRIHGRVRVIIITDEVEDDIDMVEYLMQHPLNANNATPLTRDEIYDRVK